MDNVQLTEETLLFGEVGQAIYRQGDKYFKVSRRKHTPEPCRVGEINLLLDVCAEPLHLSYVPPLPELLEQLRQSYAKYTALQFLLNGLDKTLGEELQRECIGHLDKLFKDEAVYQFVRQRFLSRPLPKEADVSHAIQYAKTAKVKALYQEALADAQIVEELQKFKRASKVEKQFIKKFTEQVRSKREMIFKTLRNGRTVEARQLLLEYVQFTANSGSNFKKSIPYLVKTFYNIAIQAKDLKHFDFALLTLDYVELLE